MPDMEQKQILTLSLQQVPIGFTMNNTELEEYMIRHYQENPILELKCADESDSRHGSILMVYISPVLRA
jgi:DNA-directed RNA polymerase specialized sigma54-like protein